jgi:hypothetical protein
MNGVPRPTHRSSGLSPSLIFVSPITTSTSNTGLTDASSEYRNSTKWKMAQYRQNGIRYISLYSDNLESLDQVFRAKFKMELGFELPTL